MFRKIAYILSFLFLSFTQSFGSDYVNSFIEFWKNAYNSGRVCVYRSGIVGRMKYCCEIENFEYDKDKSGNEAQVRLRVICNGRQTAGFVLMTGECMFDKERKDRYFITPSVPTVVIQEASPYELRFTICSLYGRRTGSCLEKVIGEGVVRIE